MIKIDHNPNKIIQTGLDSYLMSTYRISAYSHKNGDINAHMTTPATFEKEIAVLPKGPIAFNDAGFNAYNPREKTFKLTRKLLITAHAHCQKHAVVMVSSRQGMLRDTDIFKALNNRQKLVIIMPMSHLNGDAKKMLTTMYALKSEGINVGAITPNLYRLNEKSAQKMLKNIAAAGADFIIPAKMTLSNQPPFIYSALNMLKIAPRVPMTLWRDWFDLSDTIYLTASHLQVLLSDNTQRYHKLGEFKRAYKRIKPIHTNNDVAADWLNNDTPNAYVCDAQIKKYLRPLSNGLIYDYKSLSWLSPSGDRA